MLPSASHHLHTEVELSIMEFDLELLPGVGSILLARSFSSRDRVLGGLQLPPFGPFSGEIASSDNGDPFSVRSSRSVPHGTRLICRTGNRPESRVLGGLLWSSSSWIITGLEMTSLVEMGYLDFLNFSSRLCFVLKVQWRGQLQGVSYTPVSRIWFITSDTCSHPCYSRSTGNWTAQN